MVLDPEWTNEEGCYCCKVENSSLFAHTTMHGTNNPPIWLAYFVLIFTYFKYLRLLSLCCAELTYQA